MESSSRVPRDRPTGNQRPYRSKRNPPCTHCRRKKLRCDPQAEQGCERCKKAGLECSFSNLRQHRAISTTLAPKSPESGLKDQTRPEDAPGEASIYTQNAHTQTRSIESASSCAPYDSVGGLSPSSLPLHHLPEVPTPQAIQSLDFLKGCSSQVIGASGESDPWLLRHCKFDEHGLLLLHQVHFRNAGGVPLDEKIPVHFLVTADSLYEPVKLQTRVTTDDSLRNRLEELVPLEYGQRLFSLFIRFVFPTLPILSRSQLGLSITRNIPEQQTLQNLPTHLLAAVYASAQPFVKFDEYLCVVHAYSTPSRDALWRIVWEALQESIHTPHLSTLQAGVLYLHKSGETNQSSIADSAFVWSFVGTLVGLATSLGLTLECRPMGLPAWERRLRRRLWWAIYAEDKWRCLLMGRPPYIRQDEWDVTDLDNDDFRIDGVHIDFLLSTDDEAMSDAPYAHQFQYFAKLCRIADELQSSLYSLRSSQRFSSDFHGSLNIARSFLQRLKEWYSLLPPSLKLQNGQYSSVDHDRPLSNSLHFGYILLEVFIFRALLRPMVRSAAPPRLFEDPEELLNFPDMINVDDLITQIMESNEVEPVPTNDDWDENGAGSATLHAAEICAAKMLLFVTRMACSDLSRFWHSWSRIGFAAASSFIMLLLIQAPSKDHALSARRLVRVWRQALRSQSQGCDLMDLALIRLDGPHWAGLSRNFFLSQHVKEALESPINPSNGL